MYYIIYIYIYIYIYNNNNIIIIVAKASDTQAVGHGFEPRPDMILYNCV